MMLALLASLAWLSAFSAGRATGHLYAFLAPTAVLCTALFLWRVPLLRQRLRGGVVDVVLGFATGGVTLAATYLAFPIVNGWLPTLNDEVRVLYVLAAVSPATLLATVAVASAEEVIWRGALLEALRERGSGRWPPSVTAVVVVVAAAVPYALAQLGAGSWMLAAAALGLGVVWGALAFWRKSLVAPLIAHLCWTPVVLGLRPLVDLP